MVAIMPLPNFGRTVQSTERPPAELSGPNDHPPDHDYYYYGKNQIFINILPSLRQRVISGADQTKSLANNSSCLFARSDRPAGGRT